MTSRYDEYDDQSPATVRQSSDTLKYIRQCVGYNTRFKHRQYTFYASNTLGLNTGRIPLGYPVASFSSFSLYSYYLPVSIW